MTPGQQIDSRYKNSRMMLAIGIYSVEEKALKTIERLIKEDFPADRLSLLRKAGGTGDDMLGLAYTDTKERVKAWGKHGVVWGALWGMLAGATGLFVLPGIGPLLTAGPVVEALGGAIAGAAATGGAMAGAAALTQLASALHRIGVPASAIEQIHHAIETDHYIVILHCDSDQVSHCAMRLGTVGADSVIVIPIKH
ncbi:hypothetical protein MNBD_GAMMA24-1185 [hydrothermal vent metagenome]|uniref:DUF1269 domain-containing protein n=1 Tax=hydrothermal vent metagenome TaxID=652676 RepID=A0A3B1BDF8_9ZZZZ